MEMKNYHSKVYSGTNYDAIVASYYGSNNCPSALYEVCYRVHTDDAADPLRQYRVDWIYASKASAQRRAREIALYW